MRPLMIVGVLLIGMSAAQARPVRRELYGPPAPPLPPTPYDLCEAAITGARTADVPATLLPSIARVESGRLDPGTGRVRPWPWTINVNGVGSFYPSKEEVIATVRSLQASGTKSIDVGCMQVNLMHHPHAFADLDTAFDPASNAAYAVRFLTALHTQTKDWPLATAWYHSQVQDRGEEYQRQVFGRVMTPMGPARVTIAGGWATPGQQYGAFLPSTVLFGAFAPSPIARYDLLGAGLRRNQSTTRR